MQINFGKHAGKDISEVPQDYIQWAAENIKGPRGDLFRAVLGDSDDKKYTVITKPSQIEELLNYIDTYEELAFDTETTGLSHVTDKVIGFSLSGKENTAYYFPLFYWNGEKLVVIQDNFDQAKYVLEHLIGKKLITWNGSFDVRMVNSNFAIDLRNYLYAEGQVLKHLIEEEGDFALKKVALAIQEYIGFNVEEQANEEQVELKANVEKNGGSITKGNFEMYKADLPILGKYACADADLTLRVYKYYKKKAEEEGLLDFYFEEVMPLYREVTITMEEKGVKLDLDLIQKNKENIEKDIIKLEEEIIDDLFNYDQVQKWYQDKLGEIDAKPSGNFVQELVEQKRLNLPKTKSGKYSVSKKTIEKLEDGLLKDFLQGKSELDKKTEKNIKEKLYIKKNNKKINISSKPQLKEVVFNYLGETPLKKTDKGAPKLDDDMITKLAESGYKWAKLLGDYNKLIKIRGTYIDRFLDNHIDGEYYFSYKQWGTLSGRYGSDAQQLPRPKEEGQLSEIVLNYTNSIRSFFISEEGRKFIDCDYESLEPHCVHKDSKVLTTSGYKSISEVRVGDFINTKYGIRKIINKWNSNKKTLQIVTKKGVLRCSSDHKVYVEDVGWTKAEDLKVGDVLEECKTFQEFYDDINLPLYLKRAHRSIGQLTITENTAWMLGAFLGDGVFCTSSSKYVGICGLEQDEVVNHFKNILESLGARLKKYEDFRTNGMVSYRCHDSWLVDIFKKTFILADDNGKKLYIPNYILNSTRTIRLSFLAGIIDTDGTFNKTKSELSISTKSPELASNLCTLGNSLGLDFRINLSHKNNHKVYQVRSTSISNNRLYELGIQHYTICKRKKIKEKIKVGKKELPKAVILEINKLENNDMVDITVDENEEFICDNLRVHNCFAHVSGDEKLIEIFNKGQDFYSTIAIATEGLVGYSADKKADNYLGKLAPELRQKAKAYALGIPYGMTAYALSKKLEVPEEEAQRLIDNYLDAYPQLKAWMLRTIRFATANGYITSELGRKRHLNKLKTLHKIHGKRLLDFKYRRKLMARKEKDEVISMYMDYKNEKNNSINYQIQSMSASIVNRSAIKINQEFAHRNIDAWVCAQVHDQLIANVPEDKLEECLEIMQDKMENTVKLKLKLKAPPEVADNWRDGH